MNYNNKKFRPIHGTKNSETTEDTIFHYHQEGTIVQANYTSKNIVKGHLLGLVAKDGSISMTYHQVNKNGELRTGKCTSTPTILENGKIQLLETWQWTSGNQSQGTSILEEI